MSLTAYHAKYFAHDLTRRATNGSVSTSSSRPFLGHDLNAASHPPPFPSAFSRPLSLDGLDSARRYGLPHHTSRTFRAYSLSSEHIREPASLALPSSLRHRSR